MANELWNASVSRVECTRPYARTAIYDGPPEHEFDLHFIHLDGAARSECKEIICNYSKICKLHETTE